MEYEEEVEGFEDSVLLPFVAMWRRVRAWLREPLAVVQCLALAAGLWAYMWALTLACVVVGSL